MVVGAATLLERTSCPDEMVLDFLWLLSTKAGMVDDPVGFVSRTLLKADHSCFVAAPHVFKTL